MCKTNIVRMSGMGVLGALMVIMAVLAVIQPTSGAVVVPDATCVTNGKCKNLPRTPSGDCQVFANKDCDFTNSSGDIIYCGVSTGNCTLITPIQSNECTGTCVINPAFACTVKFSKCQ